MRHARSGLVRQLQQQASAPHHPPQPLCPSRPSVCPGLISSQSHPPPNIASPIDFHNNHHPPLSAFAPSPPPLIRNIPQPPPLPPRDAPFAVIAMSVQSAVQFPVSMAGADERTNKGIN